MKKNKITRLLINTSFVSCLPLIVLSCSKNESNDVQILSTRGIFYKKNNVNQIELNIEGRFLPQNKDDWKIYKQDNEDVSSHFEVSKLTNTNAVFIWKDAPEISELRIKIINTTINENIKIDQAKTKIQDYSGKYYENTKLLELKIRGIDLPIKKEEWKILDENDQDISQSFDFLLKSYEATFFKKDSKYLENIKISIPNKNIKIQFNVQKSNMVSIQKAESTFYVQNNVWEIKLVGNNFLDHKDWLIFDDKDNDITDKFHPEISETNAKFVYKNNNYFQTVKILFGGKWEVIKVTKSNEFNLNYAEYIDPEIYPEKFNDKHIFQLKDIKKSKSVHELITQTPLFKSSLNNVYHSLINYNPENLLNDKKGINFVESSLDIRKRMTRDFFKLIENVGFFGEFKINEDYDFIKYYPDEVIKDFFIKQRYLSKPDEEMKKNSSLLSNVSKDKINELIQNNTFGYLPSNLSQLLYYLDLNEISSIFNINSKLLNIYSEFDDNKGEVIFYFQTQDGKFKYICNTNEFNKLKKIKDFKQFIYDRSFLFRTLLWEYKKINPLVNLGYKFNKHALSGTVWILDRVNNPELKAKNQYEFLVGSNLHVYDLTKGFEKSNSIINKVYQDNWNGGFVAQHKNEQGSQWIIEDKIETHKNEQGFSYQTMEKAERKVPVQFLKYNVRDVEEIEKMLEGDKTVSKTTLDSLTIGSDNFLDLVWYTPDFKSENVRARNDSNSDYYFGKGNVDEHKMGTIENGGTDFAIAKIVLSKEQIDQLVPSLGEVLNTEAEKDWYIGLGNDELLNPNASVIIGGFPESEWQSSMSIGGMIKSKDRLFEKANSYSSNESQKYWTRYNEEENYRLNKHNQRADWYSKEFRPEFGHGMAIEKMLQSSIYYANFVNNESFLGGASGSMAIDSRFNLLGVLYNGLFDPNDLSKPFTNSIALLKQHSKYESWNGSIKQDVIKKLKKENLSTIKLNPKL